jgi:hypothetical protein
MRQRAHSAAVQPQMPALPAMWPMAVANGCLEAKYVQAKYLGSFPDLRSLMRPQIAAVF